MVTLTSKGIAAIWLGAVVLVLDVLAIVLRVLARMSKRISFGADDYLIFSALPLQFAYVGILLWGMCKSV